MSVNRIEDVVGRKFEIIGHGRYLKTSEHNSLVLDTEKNIFFWNSRGISGNAFDWLTLVEGLDANEAQRILGDFIPRHYSSIPDAEPVIINSELVDVFFNYGKKYRDYWRERRGFKDSTIDLFKLGYAGEGWYTIPFYVKGKFRNFQCRKDSGETRSWYKNQGPLPFNLDQCIGRDWAIMTEGPVDAISCVQAGIPAFSSNAGGHLDSRWVYELRNTFIIVAFDNDLAGRMEAVRVGKVLGTQCKIYTFEGFSEKYDPNDFFKDGHTRDELIELIKTKSKCWEEVQGEYSDIQTSGSCPQNKRGNTFRGNRTSL